jgi:hypothetical protein
MNVNNIERDVLHMGIEMFRKNTGLTLEIEPYPLQVTYRPDVAIRIIWQDLEFLFEAEIKNNITRATLGGIVQRLNFFKEKGILIARYITPQIADELRKMNIPFIDAAGNAYINEPPLFIFLKGNKLTHDYHVNRPTRTFRPAGLQVLFALLCNPDLENAPYREIAKKANVALGTVGWIIDDLRRLNYLIKTKLKRRKLIRKEDLLNRWVTAYPEQLRPKKTVGFYTADNLGWWKNAEIENFNAFWGGEVAAGWLTKYLKPHKITIYTNQPISRFLMQNKIKKDPNGDIEILRVFWNFEVNWHKKKVVPPLLVYADLLATGDARNIETARIIYENELNRCIKED